jgi:hypothetical protein
MCIPKNFDTQEDDINNSKFPAISLAGGETCDLSFSHLKAIYPNCLRHKRCQIFIFLSAHSHTFSILVERESLGVNPFYGWSTKMKAEKCIFFKASSDVME